MRTTLRYCHGQCIVFRHLWFVMLAPCEGRMFSVISKPLIVESFCGYLKGKVPLF